jgi:TetR/AcrR family transcriptional repressor of mexCD-oprJ operon
MTMSPQPAPRNALQDRVARAILDAAACVLADQGEQANMADVAAAAGVARATVYRYFPNRQALLDELAELALQSAAQGLASARIDEIRVPEAIVRAVRALVDVGDLFIAVAGKQLRPDAEQFERDVRRPLRHLVERGQADGAIRDDLPSAWLTESLVGIAVSVLSSPPSRGREDTVAAIASLFVHGAQPGAEAA